MDIPKLLKLLFYPNEKLRDKAFAVSKEKLPEIQKLIDLMFKTLKFYDALGLSAPQVGVPYRVFVTNSPTSDGKALQCFINPEIVTISSEVVEVDEGCLSFPQDHAVISRPTNLRLKFWDYY